jgi:hypothetical protein
MSYDELIKFLTERAQVSGQASAMLGNDCAVVLSVTKLRELLEKAERHQDQVAFLVVLAAKPKSDNLLN